MVRIWVKEECGPSRFGRPVHSKYGTLIFLFFSIYSQGVYLTKVRWDDRERDLVMNHRLVWVPVPPPILGAEPIRVVVLDFSGIPFADAAGAREVVQVREW